MDLLRNPLVAGLLGAVAFLGLLFAVAALLQLLRSWLAPLARLSSLEPSDDELISALRETAQRLRTRRFLRPAVEDCCIPRQKPLPPASEASVLAEEASLGRPLPTLLRRIYREVASGEFGPAYGLLGVGGGATDELDNHIGSAYKLWHGSARAEENLPPG
ncbi:MAG TPA: hypothetical protein PK413_11170, partial [Thermoanaerobaculia bacterium]|nr:hypothetical protein [Thermoanaerobaculia bacterium]